MGTQEADDVTFQAAASQLTQPVPPPPLWWQLVLLLLVLAPAPVLAALWPQGMLMLPLVPALLLHELGHLAAMWILGASDGRVLFVPLLDAAVPPARPVTVWKRGLVLLAGPLPGLALAVVLQASMHPSWDTMLGAFVAWLAIFNGVNLMAVGAFDAGRLFDLLLFHRRYALAGVVWLAPVAALLFLGWWLGLWGLYASAAIPLLVLPFHYASYRTGRAQPLDLSADVGQLDEAQKQALFALAAEDDPEAAVHSMLQLHERLTEPAPPLAGWLALVGLHLAGVLAAVGCLVMLAREKPWPMRAFDAYLKLEAELQAEYDKLPDPKDKDREEAEALRERLTEHWEELVQLWRAVPADRRGKMLSDLSKLHKKDEPGRAAWFRLLHDLGPVAVQ